MILKFGDKMDNKNYKQVYECLVAGDPKSRTKRSIQLNIIRDHALRLREEGVLQD